MPDFKNVAVVSTGALPPFVMPLEQGPVIAQSQREYVRFDARVAPQEGAPQSVYASALSSFPPNLGAIDFDSSDDEAAGAHWHAAMRPDAPNSWLSMPLVYAADETDDLFEMELMGLMNSMSLL